jgi:hypothetical protein
MQYGELSLTKLSKLSKVRFSVLKREILVLKDKGYVEIIDSGRIKVARLNYSNQKVIILKNLLEELEDI